MNRYELSEWKDAPDDSTPVAAYRLNAMNNGISDNNAEIIAIENGSVVVDKAVHITGSDGTTEGVGGKLKPIYINTQGLPVVCNPASAITKDGEGIVSSKAVYDALNNGTVSKLGTKDVGSKTRFIYLNAGTPKASTATVGSATHPVYVKNGVFTPCDNSMFKLKVNTVTMSKNVTLATTEQKNEFTLTSTKEFDKDTSSVLGVTSITFSNTHHEFHCSDFKVSLNNSGKVEAKITIPSRAEIRGASTTVTVIATVLTSETTTTLTPEFSGPTFG